MDPLSRLVATLQPRGRMELRCLFGQTWAAPHAAIGPWRAPFHVLLRGECELWLPATQQMVPLRAGSLAILPRGAAHTLRVGRPRRGGAPIAESTGPLLALKTNVADAQDADVDLLCGELEFLGRRRSVLLDTLPEALVIEFAQRPEFAWLEALVRLIAHEIAQLRPGAEAIVAELCGTLFTLALRAHLEDGATASGVLGVMRHERLAPALRAMLDEPGQPWTVASLAAQCHLSRASFARLFQQHAGTGPLELLTTLRMELASRLLAQGGEDTATVGERVGYRSEAAFNRAFARHAGMTPGRFRRAAAQGEPGEPGEEPAHEPANIAAVNRAADIPAP